MSSPLRVVHYLNQFFAGIGGEEQRRRRRHRCGRRRRARARAPGGARRRRARRRRPIICGDNFVSERADDGRRAPSRAELERLQPDVLVAGPAFGSGRYGLACALACRAAPALGRPRGHGHASGQPGRVEARGASSASSPPATSTTSMPAALASAGAAARCAWRGARALGPAEVGGLHRRRASAASTTAAVRATSARSTCCSTSSTGGPYGREVPYAAPERVTPAPPIADLSRARIAMVTTGGLVRKGNPDKQVSANAVRYHRHSVAELESLSPRGLGGVPRRLLQPHRQQQPELHPAAVLPARPRAPGRDRQACTSRSTRCPA